MPDGLIGPLTITATAGTAVSSYTKIPFAPGSKGDWTNDRAGLLMVHASSTGSTGTAVCRVALTDGTTVFKTNDATVTLSSSAVRAGVAGSSGDFLAPAVFAESGNDKWDLMGASFARSENSLYWSVGFTNAGWATSLSSSAPAYLYVAFDPII